MVNRISYVAFLVLLAALPFGGAAAAQEASKTYFCQPGLAVFCRNIHVSCAGVTSIKTASFRVLISGEHALVTVDGTDRSEAGQVFNDNGVLISLAASRDWIRIEQDGRYSHRIYRDQQAAMSYGMCQLRSSK